MTVRVWVRTVTNVSGSELLFVTQVAPYPDSPAGVHGVLDQAGRAVAQIAEMHGLRSLLIDDVRAVSAAELSVARALVLFTIGDTPWSADQRVVIQDRVHRGSLAVVALHSALDAAQSWAEYGELVGARFDGHPWTQTVDIEVLDQRHPATSHLGASWRWHDEVYQFRDLAPDAHVLLRAPVEQLDLTLSGAREPAFGYPLAWCRRPGMGRVFTTALGHFPAGWESPAYLRHLHGGLEWALTEDAEGI